ncbi:MAG TPA: type VI secretion system contractile sheath small subunit, partial [Gammaproteobacteria bacterium]
MADQKGSVAPKERVNIVYKSNVGDQSEDVELPLKMLMVGDYTGKPSDEVVEDREPVNVNKDNINDVMKSFGLSLDVAVPDKLSDEPGQEISASLKFESMKDFSPDSVARQVPELKKLLELRQALQALKGPLGNVPAFRKGIQEIL